MTTHPETSIKMHGKRRMLLLCGLLGFVPTESTSLFGGDETEYDFAILDPTSAYGSPYGGFSRATTSRLASLPLKLPNVGEELMDFEPMFMKIRDALGRPFSCRAYHEDELDPSSLTESMFEPAKVKTSSAPSSDESPTAESVTGTTRSLEEDGDEEAGDGAEPAEIPKDDPMDHQEAISKEANEKLAQLSGFCAQCHIGWWSYEWCYKGKVSQFHVEAINVDGAQVLVVEDVTSLGEFHDRTIATSNDIGNVEQSEPQHTTNTGYSKVAPKLSLMDPHQTELAKVYDNFINGDTCPQNGKPRETTAVLQCCSPRVIAKEKGGIIYDGKPYTTNLLSIHGVVESDDEVCKYTVTLCTPFLCSDKPSTSRNSRATERATPNHSSTTRTRNDRLSVEDIETMSVLEIVEASFATGRKLCLHFGTGGWWVYELCPGRHVRQVHEVTRMDRVSGASTTAIETEHMLGRFGSSIHGAVSKDDEWQHVMNATDLSASSSSRPRTRSRAPMPHGGNGAYFFQEYSGGDVCDHEDVTDSAIKAGNVGEGLVERSTTVQYGCGNELEMTVKEDSTCHYVAHVSVPALCHHQLFRAPVSKKQVIKCLPDF